MLEEMPAHTLTEWMAYAELEPFGPPLDDARHGSLLALLANVNRDPRRRPRPYKPADFMAAPDSVAPQRRVPSFAAFKTWALDHNARIQSHNPSAPSVEPAESAITQAASP